MSKEPQSEFRKKLKALMPYFVVGCLLILFAACLLSIADNSSVKILETCLGALKSTAIGVILAFFLSPMATAIENLLFRIQAWFRKKRPPKPGRTAKTQRKQFVGVSIFAVYIIFLGVLVIAFIYIIPQLLRSLNTIIGLVSNTVTWLNEKLVYASDILEDSALGPYVNADALTSVINDTLNGATSDLQSYITGLLPKLYNFILSIASSLLNFIVGIVISVYLMADRRRMIANIKKAVYALFEIEKARLILNVGAETVHIFKYFFLGKIIDSLIMGLLCAAMMSILNLDYVVLISCIVGVTNIVPYFGPWVGAILSILILLMDKPIQAMIGGIMIIAIQQLDGNLIGPYILGGTLGIRPFWILFSVTVGGAIFGVPGMLFGVPIFTVFYTFATRFMRYKLKRRDLTYADIDELEKERQAEMDAKFASEQQRPISKLSENMKKKRNQKSENKKKQGS